MAKELAEKAKKAYLEDDFDVAVDLYSKAIELDPNCAAFFADRAQAKIKTDNFTGAVADANRAIELEPTLAKAYLRMGTACMKLEEYRTAKAALEKGASVAPNEPKFKKMIDECDELRRKNELQKIISDWQSQRYTIQRSSWNELNADIILPPVAQILGNCWCIALRRQWYASMRLANYDIKDSDIPSSDQMMEDIGIKFLTMDRGLIDWTPVKAYMERQKNVDEMIIHYNTEPPSEDFEILVERLYANGGPFAVSLIIYPSYHESGHKGVLAPDPEERAQMVYRQYPSGHVALLTGRGIDLRSGKRYFELSDSNGFRHGECGNIRLARQEGLIYSAIELKIKPKE